MAESGEEHELQKDASTIENKTGIAHITVIRNIDKTHPIGQADEKGKQKRIVKLTSESFKGMVYRKHREKQKKQVSELKRNNQSVRVGIKFKLSLTRLPEVAYEKFASVEQIKFAYDNDIDIDIRK